jgi:transcriptional regulator with XRE-family HTH domain
MDTIHPLKAFRERQDPPLDQKRLAEFLGVSEPTLSRWERGIRKPGRDLLPSISAKTGIPAADLRPDLAKLFDLSADGGGPARRSSARTKSRAA